MSMKVLFFAQLREVTGTPEAELDGPEVGETDLWERLLARWPGLAVHRDQTRLARNGVYVDGSEIFRAEDEVALIPPVSGG